MITITREEHQYNATLEENDTITIYINGTPTPVTYTVKPGYIADVTFMYQEKKL